MIELPGSGLKKDYANNLKNFKQNKLILLSSIPINNTKLDDKDEDRVNINFTQNMLDNDENEMISVILSEDNPEEKSCLLSSGLPGERIKYIDRNNLVPIQGQYMTRNIQIEGTLGGGEKIAKMSKKDIANLESNGIHVTRDELEFVLPLIPSKETNQKSVMEAGKEQQGELENIDLTKSITGIENLPTTGKGVGIVILDTGAGLHGDDEGKIELFLDYVNKKDDTYDENGHGSCTLGIIGGSGTLSDGQYKGVAPDARLIVSKVLNAEGRAKVSNVVKAIDWAIENRDKYNIRVMNMSLGVPSSGYKTDLIDKAVERAYDAGILVVAAAGNEGPGTGTISSAPGNSPCALTVGAVDTKGTVEKEDDTIAEFSSKGPTTDGLQKPDLVAPGTNIISLNIKGSQIDKISKAIKYLKELPDEKLIELPEALYDGLGLEKKAVEGKSPEEVRKYIDKTLPNINYINEYYVGMSGTSMAAPIVSGVAADMIEANPRLSPKQIKEILTKTADTMGENKLAQGAGVLDAKEAIEVAMKTQGELPESFAKNMGYIITK